MCDSNETVVPITLWIVLTTVDVLFTSIRFCGAVAPGTYDAHRAMNSPYVTVSPGFTPGVRVVI